jgi:hypothetical protein
MTTRLLIGVALASLLGCGSSHETATVDAGPPVADPGGPFVADLPPDRPLAGLNLVDTDTLCRDLASAYYTFLNGAVQAEKDCRPFAVEVGQEVAYGNPGPAGAAACAQQYAACIASETTPPQFLCPFLTSLPNPRPCDATVEDLSACLNEIAALDPVSVCVTTAGCDGGLTTTEDAGAPTPDAAPWPPPAEAGPPPAAMPARPAPPACRRLGQICPDLAGWVSFPC